MSARRSAVRLVAGGRCQTLDSFDSCSAASVRRLRIEAAFFIALLLAGSVCIRVGGRCFGRRLGSLGE